MMITDILRDLRLIDDSPSDGKVFVITNVKPGNMDDSDVGDIAPKRRRSIR